ncbi:hypothetical protein EJP77_04785 [Paenibacillus zeisoli]|uniref:Uncharacterized protein n=1 Tax=Paenibacillus zeisoli TaxID=2496267 RepID=A0A433XQI7_9BACL|nr:hypothetical protein [Paenibacillus zeisoli]RUT36309.1 hypothetical protein EJP77_04785 [Paenibacillus zeisoli]
MSTSDENRKPGFEEVPDVDPNRPASTDKLEDVVGAIMDNIDGDEPGKNSGKSSGNNSRTGSQQSNADDDTQLV